MNIDTFTATVKKYGLSRPNRFEVEIELPELLLNKFDGGEPDSRVAQAVKKVVKTMQVVLGRNSSSGQRGLNTLCDTSSLPGKNITTTDVTTNGPTEQRPYGALYEDITMSFLVTEEMHEKYIIDEWMNMIVDPQTNVVGWHKDYATTIRLHQLDRKGKRVYSVVLIDAFPTNLASMEISHNQTDSVHKMSVQFAYKKWVRAENYDDENATEREDNSMVPDFLKPYASPNIINKVYDVAMGKNPGFAGESLFLYNKLSNITKTYAGVSANELGTLLTSLKRDIDGSNVSSSDKANLKSIADDVMLKIGF